MTDTELESLLADLESDRTERKAGLSDRGKIREAICAFANDLPNYQAPGVLFVGANDDGSPSGLAITDELMRSLADMRSDGNIVPFPSLTVQKRRLRGAEMVVVSVQPSDAPPVRVRGRVWIRVGPRRDIASLKEERRLSERRRSRDLPFDLQVMTAAVLDDLDLDLFRRTYLPASVAPEIIEDNQRSVEQQLKSLRLARSADGPAVPTALGLLVLGRDPRAFVPGAYAQFVRFDGTLLTDAVRDAAEVSGPLPELIRNLEERLEAHLETGREFVTSRIDVARPDYPVVALQQLARNAILHRTYEGTHAPIRIQWFSDRVEILSPGGPFGLVTKRNFGQPGVTDYRNPHLAEAMRNLGYVQNFGVGIALARKELQRNSNPELEFQVEDTQVLAIIRRRR
ncbi:MAG: ATP-binding protein [Bryobacteraceae bacterium]